MFVGVPMVRRPLGMRRVAIFVLLLLSAFGCGHTRSSPLADLGEITSARVTVFANGAATSTSVTDSTTLAQLRDLATTGGPWTPSWHTPPAGQVRAALYRKSQYVGVVSIGPDFIGARGASSEQFRPIAEHEVPIVARIRALGDAHSAPHDTPSNER
jgi:hypothetical protein